MSTTPNPTRSKARIIGLFVVAIAVAYVVFMRANPPKEVTTVTSSKPSKLHFERSEYGDAWPFKTIESGTVYCTEEKAVLFRDDRDGQIYGLNGWAKTLGRSKGYNWKSLDEEHIVGKDIGPMLDAGNKLCKE